MDTENNLENYIKENCENVELPKLLTKVVTATKVKNT